MKRTLAIVLALMLILSACGTDPAPTTQPSPSLPPETTVPVETTLPAETVDSLLPQLREDLPRMDGSTSLIPLEAGLRAALFDISIEEATSQVSHTTSWESFYNLLGGRADLVFSVPLSADQKRIAAEEGVELETIPIAMEGFVFVVNADNPVNSLTQQQIRDIYSGKITNWSEVGGLDEEIIPYQRNWDSGSQNYMIAFMGDTPLTDAPTYLRPATMSGLMDVIALNDNSRAAIGYSVYAYAADMYGNGNEIKFLQVDGVAPSKAAFADGSYPLMGQNYAIFRADTPEDSTLRKFVDWILSDEGQLAIAEAGYVTVRDIGYDYAEGTFEKYEGIGLGAPAVPKESSEYLLTETLLLHYDNGFYAWDSERTFTQLIPQIVTNPDGTQTYETYALKNAMLEQEINRWIAEQMVWVRKDSGKMEALVDRLNSGEYAEYVLTPWDLEESMVIGNSACIITAKNGILSVAVTLRYVHQGMGSSAKPYRTETASWDLATGKRLTVEDLFCQGVDIDALLNEYLKEQIHDIDAAEFTDLQITRDFAGLPAEGWHITHDTIYFDYGNPYFAHGESFSLNELPDGSLITEQLRDFSDAFDGDTIHVARQFRVTDRNIEYRYIGDSMISCGFLKEDSSPHAAEINEQVYQYLADYYFHETIVEWYNAQGYPGENLYDGYLTYDWELYDLGGRYALFRGYAPELYLEASDTFIKYPYPEYLLFDLHTGKQLDARDILKEGWQDAVITEGEITFDLREGEVRSMYHMGGYFNSTESFMLWVHKDGVTVTVGVPGEYIIF